jgi:23S rRNA (cytosine1962-C5)-methyltransferase
MILEYKLLDCGNKLKLEQIGKYKIIRPCPQAIWPQLNPELWDNKIDAEFIRTGEEKGMWKWNLPSSKIPTSWQVKSQNGLIWTIDPNEFGNIGVFVEHWQYVEDLITEFNKDEKVLNLFTYAGSNTVRLVQKGFKVTAVDSSKLAMTTYSGNLENNHLDKTGQRMILEDCYTFVKREVRREAKYGNIMIDAPSYGKGTKKEVFKIEDDLIALINDTRKLMTENGKLLITLHSPRFTPVILKTLGEQMFPDKIVTCEEILVPVQSGVKLPSGFLLKIY